MNHYVNRGPANHNKVKWTECGNHTYLYLKSSRYGHTDSLQDGRSHGDVTHWLLLSWTHHHLGVFKPGVMSSGWIWPSNFMLINAPLWLLEWPQFAKWTWYSIQYDIKLLTKLMKSWGKCLLRSLLLGMLLGILACLAESQAAFWVGSGSHIGAGVQHSHAGCIPWAELTKCKKKIKLQWRQCEVNVRNYPSN